MHHPYTTDVLAHFVGRKNPVDNDANLQKLLLVLGSGQVSYPPHSPDGDKTAYTIAPGKPLHTEELMWPTVTCFADIPEKSLPIHLEKYGLFGLGFRRDFLIRHGARPVTYVPMFSNEWMHAIGGRYMLEDIAAIYKGFDDYCEAKIADAGSPIGRNMQEVPKSEEQVLRAVKTVFELYFLAFLKPFNSELPADHIDNYYMEREWRKYGYLRFNLVDVAHVWVAKGYKPAIESGYPDLSTRITEI